MPATLERTFVDSEYVLAFVDAQPPDEERDRRAEEVRRLATSLGELRARPAALRERLDELAEELVGAPAARRGKLVAERNAIGGELSLLPAAAEVAARRYLVMLVDWVTYLARQATFVHNAAVEEMEPTRARLGALNRNLTSLTSRSDADHNDTIATGEKERGELIKTMRGPDATRRLARDCMDALGAILAQHFPFDPFPGEPITDADIAKWAALVRRAVAGV